MNDALPNLIQGEILLVDDEPDNIRLLSSILVQQGHRVRRAINGRLALMSIAAEQPDLILLDVNMPEASGYDVCRSLKNHASTRDIPVVFVSAQNEVFDKVEAFNVGGADYITKPFHIEEVLARIQHQLTIRQQKQLLVEQNQRLHQEICDRKQAQAETQLLLTTMQAVTEAADFEAALRAVVQEVCRAINWDYAHAWVIGDNGIPAYADQTFYRHSTSALIFPHPRSTATIAAHAKHLSTVCVALQPEWIEDLSSNPQRLYLHTPLDTVAELKTALYVPIVVEQQILAVLGFFRTARLPQDAKLMQLVHAVAMQLGSLMQRKQAEAALKLANLELQRLATLDGLTQIANRRCFDDYLHQEWKRLRREQAPLSLILCDIDDFKPYNDYYGHQAGDSCLHQVAQVIKRTVHRPADLVARYGGEEFAVILPNTDLDGATHIAKHIQRAIAALHLPHSRSRTHPFLTLSLGIASMIVTQHADINCLITEADRALYRAKAKGRNTYCAAIAGIPTFT